MAEVQILEVVDQWDDILGGDDLHGALEDALLIASDEGSSSDEMQVYIVPCVPGTPINAGDRVTGMKVARDTRDGVTDLAVYLFVQPA